MPDEDPLPGKIEASAVLVAGIAFAASLVFLRRALSIMPGVFDAGAVILIALGAAPWAHRWKGPAAATLVRGAGLVVGALLLSSSLIPPFYGAVVPAAMAIAGGSILQANARRKAPTVAWDSLGATILSAALALGLVIASGFPEPDRLRLTLLIVGGASLVGLITRRILLSTRASGFAPMPVGILLVAAIGGAYLSYRSLVKDHVANLPLYEWSAAAAAGSLLLARLRRRAKDQEVPDAWSANARRHAQDVRPVYDARMGPLAGAIGRWLERGEGFDEYQAAMQRFGARVHENSRNLRGRRGKSGREAAQQRLAAHRAAMSTLSERGTQHGIHA